MRKAKSYTLTSADRFENIAWISSQELWITACGILTDAGLRDHFGRGAVKEAMKVATKCDHLRFDRGRNCLTIVDALSREGLNLATHPFLMHCFLNTMWRFQGPEMDKTLSENADSGRFYGWIENIAAAVSKRDGLPYERPGNMFGDIVHLDH
ncbi:hypothetical protein OO012_19375 [Rhodobacteraceae bacterium KMM 6894]|nr:hypothetical protein [Rhodobacteraceae bacterium KMM 6894]